MAQPVTEADTERAACRLVLLLGYAQPLQPLLDLEYRLPANCCSHVVGSNSARLFRCSAPILRKSAVQQLLADNHGGRIVEIGAGCLRNALYLQHLGFRVTVVELPALRQRFYNYYRGFEAAGGGFVRWPEVRGALAGPPTSSWRGPFDLAIMTFVIETICRPRLRLALLRECRTHLRQGGSLIISVRGLADVGTARAKGARCSDGYLTPLKTFIRPYDRPQLEQLLRGAGFRTVQFLHAANTVAPELLHAVANA
jgi:hypothetical protein